MKILILGNGGREHALAWKCSQSPKVTHIFVAPGNAGTLLEPKVQNLPLLATDIKALLQFAQQEKIDLTIVGPEAPLVIGIVDAFQSAGLAIFGPCQYAAQLEGSKVFSKQFFSEHHIPTAAFGTFHNSTEAIAYLDTQSYPIVIKADGLAAGKGVVIAHSRDEAINAINMMLNENRFGAALPKIVIEQFLAGTELSFIVISDGKKAFPFPTSQDHKTLYEAGKGPNTGGMGAYSPCTWVDTALTKTIMETIISPTLKGLAEKGRPYVGFLYAGLMIVNDKPYLLEYNCRLGDPEAQVLLMRLTSSLPDVLLATLASTLSAADFQFDPRPSVGVVLASEGYPDNPHAPQAVDVSSVMPTANTKLFYAGTTLKDGTVFTQGGRNFTAVAMAQDFTAAKALAYELVAQVKWPGKVFRKDIGAASGQ